MGKGLQFTQKKSLLERTGSRSSSVNESIALARLHSSGKKKKPSAVLWEPHLLSNFNMAVTSSL